LLFIYVLLIDTLTIIGAHWVDLQVANELR